MYSGARVQEWARSACVSSQSTRLRPLGRAVALFTAGAFRACALNFLQDSQTNFLKKTLGAHACTSTCTSQCKHVLHMTEAQTGDRNPGTDGRVVALGTSQPLRPHTAGGNSKACLPRQVSLQGNETRISWQPNMARQRRMVRHAACREAL